jgi:hypothetical protein
MKLAKAFAAQHDAQTFDRGSDAQDELAEIDSAALLSTRACSFTDD